MPGAELEARGSRPELSQACLHTGAPAPPPRTTTAAPRIPSNTGPLEGSRPARTRPQPRAGQGPAHAPAPKTPQGRAGGRRPACKACAAQPRPPGPACKACTAQPSPAQPRPARPSPATMLASTVPMPSAHLPNHQAPHVGKALQGKHPRPQQLHQRAGAPRLHLPQGGRPLGQHVNLRGGGRAGGAKVGGRLGRAGN